MASIGTIWDRTVDFVRDERPAILPVALAALFVPTVVTVTLEGVRQEATGAVAALLVLVTVAASLVSYWGQLFITAHAIAPASRAASSRRATTRFLPMIGVSIPLGLAIVVLMIPAIALIATSGVDFTAIQQGTATIPDGAAGPFLWAAIYALVLAPVVIWLFARLLTLTGVVLMERRGLGAIARAFRMTRGMGLKLVGLFLLYAVVSTVAVSAVRFVLGSILAIVTPGEGPVTIGVVVTAIAVSAVSTVLSVLVSAFGGKLYATLAEPAEPAAVFE